MAKYFNIIEYDIRLYDHVVFLANREKGIYIEGVVQSLINFPDTIWVETGSPGIEWNRDPLDFVGYRRWEITLDRIDFKNDRTESQVYDKSRVDYKRNEETEFVYSEDYRQRIPISKA